MPRTLPTHSIAARLRLAIQANGTTAAELATKCGFSKQNMQRFVNGDVTRSKHFPTIAKVLNISLTWLTVGDVSSAPSWSGGFGQSTDATPSLPLGEPHPALRPGWSLVPVPRGLSHFAGEIISAVIVDTHQRPPHLNRLVCLRSGTHMVIRRVGKTTNGKTIVVDADGRNAETLPVSAVDKAQPVVGFILKA